MSTPNAICSPQFRLNPDAEQKRQIDKTLDAVRFVYNYFMALGRKQYAATQTYPGRFEMQRQLPALKEKYPWLKEADSVALQVAVQHLSWTFENFLARKRQGLPVRLHFKDRYEYFQSYRREAGRDLRDPSQSRHVRIVGNSVKISKLGLVKFRQHQRVEGRIIAATITREGTDRCAKYYISFYYEPVSPRPPFPATGQAVGIDLGLKTYATLSTGEKIEISFTVHQKQLDTLYEQLRRQEPGSKRWEKTYNQIKRLKEKIRRNRLDAFHKLSAGLVENYDIICIESLNTYTMKRKTPAMKRAIDRASWGAFKRILAYKCEEHGRQLVEVGQYYPSSQVCSACGYQYRGAKNLKVREWTCPVCGTTHDRDTNAAINILQEGLRILPYINNVA